MTDLIFEKFPSIKRLKRSCVITEKIDGTNAQINFDEDGNILCGSRSRQITPEQDNYGFASWAYNNQGELFKILGEGRHYGEWWGQGIQRRYGMDKKIFSLFNSGRWHKNDLVNVDQLSVVPVLYAGEFTSDKVDSAMSKLKDFSIAASGYKKPEGIVVFHSQIKQMFKVTFEHDSTGKPYGA
jgi:RNA ligase